MHEIATYNGWSNRETWLVNLWLSNEEYSSDVLSHIVKAFETTTEQAEEIEHWLRAEFEAYTAEASMWSELLGTALNRVNWYEIAESNQ